MDFQEFARYHLPALESDEVRFNVQIAVIMAAMKDLPPDLEYWTLGGPGHCATRSPGRAILLGALDRAECEILARYTKSIDYPGVVGCDYRARWFADAARELGIIFNNAIPQRIHILEDPPQYPDAQGCARAVAAEDVPLLFKWITAFNREAVPHEPPPQLEIVEKSAAGGRYLFWTAGEQPVSMAAIARRLQNTAAIAPVYTPPHQRCRGYAGSVTAALVDRAFAEGKKAACLYTDLRNPSSNRCYARIGFRPYCDSLHYLRSLSD